MENTAPNPRVHGIHHVSVIAGDPQENLDFYTRIMGMRLVKKTVNQDAPGTYHLFYADAEGSPGTDLTFFPIPDLPRHQPGPGQIVEVPFAVPLGSIPYWQERLDEHNVPFDEVETRFGEQTLPFEDPHGLRLALVETDDERDFVPWENGSVPARHQLRGMHSVRLWETQLEPTETVLTDVLGFDKIGDEDGWHRFGVGGGGSGKIAEVRVVAEVRGSGGSGGVHHAAWRMRDSEEEMELRNVIARVGLQPSAQIDRFWFKSVYFREPGGALFELATDGPGFTADEELEHLGDSLVLPPWLEGKREKIEASLISLETPSPPVQEGPEL